MGILQDKVIIITGATGGIGSGIVYEALDEGAYVLAAGLRAEDLEQLVNGAPNRDRLQTRVVDVTKEQEVADLVQAAVDTWGRLDGMANNAGILIPNNVVAATYEEYQAQMDVNVKGVFFGCKYAIPAMLKTGGGSIVNTGSINSIAAEKELTLYCASKGAVYTLTQAVALDFGAQGIRANTLCPGFVDTPLNVPHYTKLGGRAALEAALPDFQPIGRPIEPREIGSAVTFLLSSKSSAITGTAFVVDGGVLCKA